jgi:uncharacterized protein YwgA
MQLDFFTEPTVALPESPESSFIEPSWVALVEVLRRIEQRQYRWPVGRVRFQKIAYFLTAEGLPTALEYRRDSYGPYAPNLKPVASRLINNGLVTEQRLGQMIEMRSGPTYEDARSAFKDALAGWSHEIDKVVDLFARMPTDHAEVAATVHFAATELRNRRDRPPTEQEVLDEVKQWKARRRPPMSETDIIAATEQLALLRWIEVLPSPELHDDADEDLFVG